MYFHHKVLRINYVIHYHYCSKLKKILCIVQRCLLSRGNQHFQRNNNGEEEGRKKAAARCTSHIPFSRATPKRDHLRPGRGARVMRGEKEKRAQGRALRVRKSQGGREKKKKGVGRGDPRLTRIIYKSIIFGFSRRGFYEHLPAKTALVKRPSGKECAPAESLYIHTHRDRGNFRESPKARGRNASPELTATL